ncbi:MAG: 2-amino-4-hydroxy-6-hydroxymethyldihydropteridine diphosphokinase [bacterium]
MNRGEPPNAATPPPVVVYLGVGSNIKPARNLPDALRLLLERDQRITATSTVLRTPAIGRPEQDDYFNCVWRLQTRLTPLALRDNQLRPIEAELGRIRGTDGYASRPIDLDILLHGELVRNEPDLQLPDPEIGRRAFLALGLQELAPELPLLQNAAIRALMTDVAGKLATETATTAALRKLIRDWSG